MSVPSATAYVYSRYVIGVFSVGSSSRWRTSWNAGALGTWMLRCVGCADMRGAPGEPGGGGAGGTESSGTRIDERADFLAGALAGGPLMRSVAGAELFRVVAGAAGPAAGS